MTLHTAKMTIAVWEEFTSQANSDVYATKFSADFSSQTGGIIIDATNAPWTAPAVGYSRANDEALAATSASSFARE